MAAGRRQLSKVQLGLEATPGTAVAADTVWRGAASFIEDQREIVRPEEYVGIFGGTDRTYIPKLLAQLALGETEATFEQLPLLFILAGWMSASGVADGTSSSGYKYTATIPTTAAPSLTGKTATIETGDDAEAEELEYAHTVEINLSGTAGEAVMMSATLQGRQAARTTFTVSLSVTAVEEILASLGALYLDDAGGTIGTTQVSNQLLAFDITFTFNWVPKFTFDGQKYFSFAHYSGHEITGSLTYEHDSTSIAGTSGEKAKWRSETPRLMRLEFTGAALGTPGTGTTFDGTKGLRVDLPIVYDRFNPIDERDGNSIVVAEFTSKYNATYGSAGSIVAVNEIASY